MAGRVRVCLDGGTVIEVERAGPPSSSQN